MADLKYGQIYTAGDIEKIFEHLKETGALTTPQVDADQVLSAMDEKGVHFKFPPGEPTFTLRARDKRAIAALRFYSDHQSPRASQNHLQGLEDAQDAFDDYRIHHPNELKEPD